MPYGGPPTMWRGWRKGLFMRVPVGKVQDIARVRQDAQNGRTFKTIIVYSWNFPIIYFHATVDHRHLKLRKVKLDKQGQLYSDAMIVSGRR